MAETGAEKAVVAEFDFGEWRHPEQSRFSGGAKDLACIFSVLDGVAVSPSGQALAPLARTRGFGMTPREPDSGRVTTEKV